MRTLYNEKPLAHAVQMRRCHEPDTVIRVISIHSYGAFNPLSDMCLEQPKYKSGTYDKHRNSSAPCAQIADQFIARPLCDVAVPSVSRSPLAASCGVHGSCRNSF